MSTPMQPIITSLSEIRTKKRCPLKWRLGSSNHLRLSPRITGMPFELGTSVHAALAAWTIDPSLSREAVLKVYMQKSLEISAASEAVYKEHVGVAPTEIEKAKLLKNADLGLQMVANYMNFWGAPLEAGYTLIEGSEQEFLVDIPGTPHKLKGFLDHAILNPDGLLLVMDRKTYGNRPSKEALLSDEQFVGYVWAMSQIHGRNAVAGIAYDGLWKRLEPNAKYKQEWSDLFLRCKIQPTQDQLTNFEQELVHTVNEMAAFPRVEQPLTEFEHDPRFYKNRHAGCLWDCKEFLQICDGIRMDDDVPLIMRQFYRQRTLDDDRRAMRAKYDLGDD